MTDDDRRPTSDDDAPTGPGGGDPGTGVADPGRRRRGRVIAISAVALVAVAGVAIAVQALSSGGTAAPASAPTTSTVPSPSPTPEPSTPIPAPAARPLVAITSTGDLVTIDPTTGATLGVVATGYETALSVTPDGENVYVSRTADNDALAGGGGEIVLVSLTDGSETPVVDGGAPAVSPDGASLAYLRLGTSASDQDKTTLVIRDIATGKEREIPDSESAFSERAVGQPTWTADSQRVAISLGWWEQVDDSRVVMVDVATTTTLTEAPQLSPVPDAASPSARTSWSSPTKTSDGSVAVAASRQELDTATGKGSVTLGAVLLLDSHSGAITSELTAPSGTPLKLAAEPEGRGLALTMYEAGTDGTPTYTLYLSDGSTPFASLAKGILAISW